MMRLLRLPFWAYFIAAPLVLAFAIFFYIDDRSTEAGKARARAGTAPATVAIENYDPARNLGPANEVQIIGQVDVSRMMELTETKRGVERDRWLVAPIYAAGAKDTSGPALGVFEQRGTIDDAQIARMIVAQGAFGPVMRINGAVTTDYKAEKAVRKAMEKVSLAPDAVIVDPFENGRMAGLAANPDGVTIAAVIAGLSLIVAGYGWFLFARKRRADLAGQDAYGRADAA